MSSLFYRIQSPHVIREQFDDEVVIVNLESGVYYSLDDVSAIIWTGLEHKKSVSEILTDVCATYTGELAEIETELGQFLQTLCIENLIKPEPDQFQSAPVPPIQTRKRSDASLPFSAPRLNKYTDMQDLLLLDPIHEVDETGWPTPKTLPTAQ